MKYHKIRPVGGELFHADGHTHMMKLTVTVRNFVNVPKKLYKVSQVLSTRNHTETLTIQ